MIGKKFYEPLEDSWLEVLDYVEETEDGQKIEHTKRVDNPSENTKDKYCEAVGWCNTHDAFPDWQDGVCTIRKNPPKPEPSEAEKAQAEIASLKSELATYDYIGTKIAMGVATREDYATEIAHTEELRKRINELEPIALKE